jgi:hypothetical protein
VSGETSGEALARISLWPMTRVRNASTYALTSGSSGMRVLARQTAVTPMLDFPRITAKEDARP